MLTAAASTTSCYSEASRGETHTVARIVRIARSCAPHGWLALIGLTQRAYARCCFSAP
jgi:hypothetical protein